MKKIGFIILLVILSMCTAFALDNLDAAYRKASSEAGNTTTTLVESIDLQEFEDHFGLSLSEDDEMLIRIALMAYSNGAMLEHPKGINGTELASIEDDPYVGNRNTMKFHYSWCSSVSDIKEKNKVTFKSREEAIRQHYVPCKRCNP